MGPTRQKYNFMCGIGWRQRRGKEKPSYMDCLFLSGQMLVNAAYAREEELNLCEAIDPTI